MGFPDGCSPTRCRGRGEIVLCICALQVIDQWRRAYSLSEQGRILCNGPLP